MIRFYTNILPTSEVPRFIFNHIQLLRAIGTYLGCDLNLDLPKKKDVNNQNTWNILTWIIRVMEHFS